MAPEPRELNALVVEALEELLIEPTREEPALVRARLLADHLAALQYVERVISAERRRAIMDMRDVGLSLEEIGQLLGMTRQSVHRLMSAPERELDELEEVDETEPATREPVRAAAKTLADALSLAGTGAAVQAMKDASLIGVFDKAGLGGLKIGNATGIDPVALSAIGGLNKAALAGLSGSTLAAISGVGKSASLGRTADVGRATPMLNKVQNASVVRDNKEGEHMPKKPAIHTVPHGDGWANRREGASRVSNTSKTKATATAKGREMANAEKAEHVIHNKDGAIGKGGGSKQSYGNDPTSSKG